MSQSYCQTAAIISIRRLSKKFGTPCRVCMSLYLMIIFSISRLEKRILHNHVICLYIYLSFYIYLPTYLPIDQPFHLSSVSVLSCSQDTSLRMLLLETWLAVMEARENSCTISRMMYNVNMQGLI